MPLSVVDSYTNCGTIQRLDTHGADVYSSSMNDMASRDVTVLPNLLHLCDLVNTALDRQLAPLGLSFMKLSALREIALADGKLHLSVLAERLVCVKSNVTQLVDRLEKEGLLWRERDPQDRRAVLAILTEQGRERFQAGMGVYMAAEANMLDGLPLGQRHQLRMLLDAIRV